MSALKESTSKHTKQSYGKEALDAVPDITEVELQKSKKNFLKNHIEISAENIKGIERITKQQSLSSVRKIERQKRITASVFGSVVNVKPLVQRLIYTSFKGNRYTRKGLQEERSTIHEYKLKKAEKGVNVDVISVGLVIDKNHKFLGASPDGKVVEVGGETGLIEVKNLLLTKAINLNEAVKSQKDFCLEIIKKKLKLKKSHDYYYQCQGLVNISNLPWIDFVVRCVNPYQIHIERIVKDENLWETIMLPKLSAFYHKALLPELCSPRHGKVPGIREPGIWFDDSAKTKLLKRPSAKLQTAGSINTCKSKRGNIIQNTGNRQPTSTIISSSAGACNSSSSVIPHSTPDSNSSTASTFAPDISINTTVTRRSARTRIKFVERAISHKWKVDDTSGKTQWYKGYVSSCISGRDGYPEAVYEVFYDSCDEPYEIDHLYEDYLESSVKFIDV